MPKKQNMEKLAREWVALKEQEKETEKRLNELKSKFQPFLKGVSDHSVELAGWRFTLVEFEKESFSLSRAREKLPEKTLAPYISKVDVMQIRTSWQGGEKD